MNDGTEEFTGVNSRGLGDAVEGFVRIGRLNSSGTLQDPIDGNDVAATAATRTHVRTLGGLPSRPRQHPTLSVQRDGDHQRGHGLHVHGLSTSATPTSTATHCLV